MLAVLLGLALRRVASFLLRTRTLYLSKSVKLSFLACLAYAFPKELSANFWATFSFLRMVLTFWVLAPLRILALNLVSCSLRMGMTCLLMVYPSTNTLLSLMISTIVASLPASTPKLILATRPTSTNLVYPWIKAWLPSWMCGEIYWI